MAARGRAGSSRTLDVMSMDERQIDAAFLARWPLLLTRFVLTLFGLCPTLLGQEKEMEVHDDFPVRPNSISLDVQGNQTEIIISGYADHVLVLASQIGSMGTILLARKEEGLAVAPTFNVTVVFGKRNEPMLVACARQIIQHMSDTGSTKALVLSLGLRDHSMETMKAIVSTIKEKLPEVT